MHCNTKRRTQPLLATTVTLAETFGATLLGLSVVPPVAVISTGPADGPPMVIDAHCQLYRAENPAMKSAFEANARGRALTAEWREDEADGVAVAARVLQYASAADPKSPATEQVAPHASVGQTLLACAKDFEADFLVMGCYGHTRLREIVLGGASRHVLAHMSLPVLMAHRDR